MSASKTTAKQSVTRRAELTRRQVAQLHSETMLSEGTIRQWADGREGMRESTMRILAIAAAKMGIQVIS